MGGTYLRRRILALTLELRVRVPDLVYDKLNDAL